MIPLDTSRDISQTINAHNHRSTSRVEGVVNVIVATVLGVLGAAALLHFATPCTEGALCAILAVRPAYPRWALRAYMLLRARYLRTLIAAAEQDAEHHEEMALLSPQAAYIARQHAAALRVQLADCTKTSRA